MTEDIRIDPSLRDLPRVGVTILLPSGFEGLRWSGFGPGSAYPDRRAAVRRGVWRSTVGGQEERFVMPQEHGLRIATDWFELTAQDESLLIEADRPFAFSALHHTAADLSAATHAHQLPQRDETFVHLDLAHRGLGTFACGPDTHERHRLHGGRYRLTWTVSGSRSRR